MGTPTADVLPLRLDPGAHLTFRGQGSRPRPSVACTKPCSSGPAQHHSSGAPALRRAAAPAAEFPPLGIPSNRARCPLVSAGTVNPRLPGTSCHCPHPLPSPALPRTGTSRTGLAAHQRRRGCPERGTQEGTQTLLAEGLVLKPPDSGLGEPAASLSGRHLDALSSRWICRGRKTRSTSQQTPAIPTWWLETPQETSVGAKSCQVKRAWPREDQGKASRTG